MLAGGCHTARDTTAAIEHAGSITERLTRLRYANTRIPFPVSPQILGTATRPPARSSRHENDHLAATTLTEDSSKEGMLAGPPPIPVSFYANGCGTSAHSQDVCARNLVRVMRPGSIRG
jgi:hypothetical protein